MLQSEIDQFTEALGLPSAPIGRDDTAQICLAENCEFFIDASDAARVYLYLMLARQFVTKDLMLKGLSICDSRKIVGVPMHFVGDQNERLGFLAILTAEEATATAFMAIFQQLMQAQMRFEQLEL